MKITIKSLFWLLQLLLISFSFTFISLNQLNAKEIQLELLDVRPSSWDRISEEQFFLLGFNRPPIADEISSKIFFTIQGIEDKIEVEILGREVVKKIAQYVFLYSVPYKSEAPSSLDKLVVVKARRKFPFDQKVFLHFRDKLNKDFEFQVREDFHIFLECQRASSHSQCSPFSDLEIKFSRPVRMDEVQRKIQILKGEKELPLLQILKEAYQKENWSYSAPLDNQSEISKIAILAPHDPQYIYKVHLKEGNLFDVEGNDLQNKTFFPATIQVDPYPPLVKFNGNFGIVGTDEKGRAEIPLSVRSVGQNLKSKITKALSDKTFWQSVRSSFSHLADDKAKDIISWMKRSSQIEDYQISFFGGEKKSGISQMDLPVSVSHGETEVMGIPIAQKGFYVFEIENELLKEAYQGQLKYVKNFTLVTDMVVHLKLGKKSSLAWVTSLNQASPISGAKLTLFSAKGEILFEGQSDSLGRVTIPEFSIGGEKIYDLKDYPYNRPYEGGLYLFASYQDDITFVHSSWDKGIENYRYEYRHYRPLGPYNIHVVTDRPIYQAGEHLSGAVVLRQHTEKGLEFVNEENVAQLMKMVVVYDSIYDENNYREEIKLIYDQQGTAEFRWKIPQNGKKGTYFFFIEKVSKVNGEERKEFLEIGNVLVKEFKIPLTSAFVRGPKEDLIRPEKVQLTLGVDYLAGGSAEGEKIEVRSKIVPMASEQTKNQMYENYNWNNGKVKERNELSQNYQEDSESQDKSVMTIPVKNLVLKAGGQVEYLIDAPLTWEENYLLTTEFSYRDLNGLIKTTSSTIPLYNSDYMIGIKPKDSSMRYDKVVAKVAILDRKGKAVINKKVQVRIYELRHYTHRNRMVGGFYSYRTHSELLPPSLFCEGITDGWGMFECEGKVTQTSGNMIFEAETVDEKNNSIMSHHSFFLHSHLTDNWFFVGDSNRMDIYPISTDLKVGEKAKFQINGPFQRGKMLVNFEREGVLDSYVLDYDRKNPIIELPIKENYTPLVYLSALLISPRNSELKALSTFDPGKPEFRLGIKELEIDQSRHNIEMKISTDKEIYKPQEKVHLKIKILNKANQNRENKKHSVMVAVVDEGLLSLAKDRRYYLKDFILQGQNLEVKSFSPMIQLVGKRHFGKKATSAGGGGGMERALVSSAMNSRSVFETLLYWSGPVLVDEKGEIDIDFKTNDSLTSYVVYVMAQGGSDLFGTEKARFKVQKEFSLFSGIPLFAREGDQMDAIINVQDLTGGSATDGRDVTLLMKIYSDQTQRMPKIITKKMRIKKGELSKIIFPLTISDKIQNRVKRIYEISAYESDGNHLLDSLRVEQTLLPRLVEVTPFVLFYKNRNNLSFDLPLPEGILADYGGIHIALKKNFSEEIKKNVITYFKRYTYNCFEQRLAKEVAFKDWEEVKSPLNQNDLLNHFDGEGLIKYYPTLSSGSFDLTVLASSLFREINVTVDAKISDRISKVMWGIVNNQWPHSLERDSFYKSEKSRRLTKLKALTQLSQLNEKVTWEQIDSFIINPKGSEDQTSIEYFPFSSLVDLYQLIKNFKKANSAGTGAGENEKSLMVINDLEKRVALAIKGKIVSDVSGYYVKESNEGAPIASTFRFINLLLSLKNDPYFDFEKEIFPLFSGTLYFLSSNWQFGAPIEMAYLSMVIKKLEGVGSLPIKEGGSTQETKEIFVNVGSEQFVMNSETELTLPYAAFIGDAKSKKVTLKWGDEGGDVTSDDQWLWVMAKGVVDPKFSQPHGFSVEKIVEKIRSRNDLEDKKQFFVGDVLKVTLKVKSDHFRGMWALFDPLPSGVTLFDQDFIDQNIITSNGLKKDELPSSYPDVNEHSSSEFIGVWNSIYPPGIETSYLIRLNIAGSYKLPQTKVESVFKPDIFGIKANEDFVILP